MGIQRLLTKLHPSKKSCRLTIQESKIPTPKGSRALGEVSRLLHLQFLESDFLFLWHIPELCSKLTLMEIPGGPGEPGEPATPGTPGCPFCPCNKEKREREGCGNSARLWEAEGSPTPGV